MVFDFALFCLCCAWFLKKHARSVEHEMAQEQAHATRLHEYKNNLSTQVEEHIAAKHQQVRTCEDLSQKIMVWKQRFETEQKQALVMQQVYITNVNEKYRTQMQVRQQELYKDVVAAEVLEQVRQQMQQKFATERENKAYNDECLHVLEQRGR